MSPLLGRTDHAARTLPIATSATVLAHTKVLVREHRKPLTWVLLWHGVAALVALAGPWVVGQVVQEVTTGSDGLGPDRPAHRPARRRPSCSRRRSPGWPAGRPSCCRSGSSRGCGRTSSAPRCTCRSPSSSAPAPGDLVARTTNDIDSLAHIIRFGIPAIVVAVTTVAATTVAAVLTSPLAALSLLTAALVQVPTSRWYLRRAGDGYLWEHASYARLNGVAAETIDGARTMDALGLQEARGRRFREALARVRRRRGLHDGPAAAVVPLARDRLLPADRDVGAVGRLARLERPHLDRRRHRRDAVHPAAARPPRASSSRGSTRSSSPRPRSRGSSASPRCPRTGSRPEHGPTARTSTSRTSGTRTARGATCCTACRWGWSPVSGWPSSARRGPASRPSGGSWPASTGRGPAGSPVAACRSSTSSCRCCAARWRS